MCGILQVMDEIEYRERMTRDVARWRREGLLTEEQERRILARMGAGERQAVRALRLGWIVTGVSIVGALVLAGGVTLFFATNWQEIPEALRVALIVAGIVAAYAVGYALMYRYEMQRVGSAFLLLGTLLYQAGVFLVAEIYNMPVDSPWLFALAAAGAFPLAYLFGSRIVLLVAIAWSIAWVVTEVISRYEDTPEFEASFLIIAVAGIAIYAIGRLHTARASLERFGEVYMLAGALVTLALVYVFSFRGIWDEIVEGVESYSAPPLVYLAIGATAVLVNVALFIRPADRERRIEAGLLLGLLGLGVIVATWPDWTGWAIAFNAAYFGVAAAIVVRGTTSGDERYVNFGLAIIGLGLLTRYVDVFWPMLDQESTAAAFFIIGGVLLLVVAIGLEWLRREIIRSMPDGGDRGGDRGDERESTLPPGDAKGAQA